MANKFCIPAIIDTDMTAAFPDNAGEIYISTIVMDGANGSTALTIKDRNDNVVFETTPASGDHIHLLQTKVNGFKVTSRGGGIVRINWA